MGGPKAAPPCTDAPASPSASPERVSGGSSSTRTPADPLLYASPTSTCACKLCKLTGPRWKPANTQTDGTQDAHTSPASHTQKEQAQHGRQVACISPLLSLKPWHNHQKEQAWQADRGRTRGRSPLRGCTCHTKPAALKGGSGRKGRLATPACTQNSSLMLNLSCPVLQFLKALFLNEGFIS